MLLVLSQEDIRRAISMGHAIEIVKGAFAPLSTGRAVVPIRISIEAKKHEGVILFMPAYLEGSEDLAIKIASVFPRNLEAGLPTTTALVVVQDARTGAPLAVMDGTYLTALRTGAASGAATDLLAREDAKAAAIFGAGAQGRTQLLAICEVRDIERAWVYDVSAEAAEGYVQEMRGQVSCDLKIASSPAKAMREADVICTATTSKTPVFADGDLKPGVHINAIGAFTPQMQEIPAETVKKAKIVVGSREGCLAEAGDIIIPLKLGLITEEDIAELGEIVAGKKRGRENKTEITLFKSVGNAVQDASVAGRVLRRAEELGLGTEVEL